MFVLTVEYFTGSYVAGDKQYKLTTIVTDDSNYEKLLTNKFGKDNYFILCEETEND